MKIPWSDISIENPPKQGDTWGFNIGRHRQQQMEKESRWSGGSLYEPKRYGKLIFNLNPNSLDLNFYNVIFRDHF